jgi:hypothetical protein
MEPDQSWNNFAIDTKNLASFYVEHIALRKKCQEMPIKNLFNCKCWLGWEQLFKPYTPTDNEGSWKLLTALACSTLFALEEHPVYRRHFKLGRRLCRSHLFNATISQVAPIGRLHLRSKTFIDLLRCAHLYCVDKASIAATYWECCFKV